MYKAWCQGRSLATKRCHRAIATCSAHCSTQATRYTPTAIDTSQQDEKPDNVHPDETSSRARSSGTAYPRQSKLEREWIITAQKTGPLSSEGRKLEQQLQSGEIEPIATLQQYLDNDRVTSEVVRLCLISAKANLNKLPRKLRPIEARRTHPGVVRRLLVHMWGDPQLWVPIVCTDQFAQEALCYLAIIEGLEDYLHGWIKADIEPHLLDNAIEESVKDEQWRSSLLRNFVSAHLNLDTTSKADLALETFFIVVDAKSERASQLRDTPVVPRTGLIRTSLKPARTRLLGAISSGTIYKTDSALYDRFVEFCNRNEPGGNAANEPDAYAMDIAVADLGLHHPTVPTPGPAMKFLRGLDNGRSFHQHNPHLASAVSRVMAQTHMLLTEQNRTADAAWVEGEHRKAFGETVNIHKFYKLRFWKPPPRETKTWETRNTIYRPAPALVPSKLDMGAGTEDKTKSKLDRETFLTERRAGPLSSEAQALAREFASGEVDLNPMATLHQYIDKGQATSDIIRVCLLAAKADLVRFPRRERVSEARKRQLNVGRVLTHIWGDAKLWVPIVCQDSQATQALCFLAIIEGLGDYMMEWITAELDAGTDTYNPTSGMRNGWRSALLDFLLVAHLNVETARKADTALNYFFKAVDLKAQLKAQHKSKSVPGTEPGFFQTSFKPACRSLVSTINTGSLYHTNPELYDRFASFCNRTAAWEDRGDMKAVESSKITAADLDLHHPTIPSAGLAIEYLRDVDRNGGLFQPHPRAAFMYRRLMEQAHMLLTEKNQGHEDAAMWIERKYREVFGEPVRDQIPYKGRFWKPPPRSTLAPSTERSRQSRDELIQQGADQNAANRVRELMGEEMRRTRGAVTIQ